MPKIHQPALPSNPDAAFSLFAAAEPAERRPPIPFAAGWLRRHHPLSPDRATLLAALAGLSVDGAR